MYKQSAITSTSIKVDNSYIGETIEQKIDRIVNNNEPISDGAPLIYTNRNEGVRPEYDIRTDRFEIAVDAMNVVTKTHIAKREERSKLNDKKSESTETKKGETQPIQGTDTPTQGQ